MDRPADEGTGTAIALALDALTAVPWFVVSPLVRPWHLRWGATADEVHGAMPGDEVVPRAQFNATRAVTVETPPERVWPWIVQLGYGRAGFYTYDLIDNAGQTSAERVLEEYQHPAVGDLMPMFKELHGLAIAYTVTAFETDHWMIWVHRPQPNQRPDSTWTWRLAPLPGGRTRLVTRMKQDYRWETPGLAIFNFVLMEMGDFAMERRMLKGIKRRAESAATSPSDSRRSPTGGSPLPLIMHEDHGPGDQRCSIIARTAARLQNERGGATRSVALDTPVPSVSLTAIHTSPPSIHDQCPTRHRIWQGMLRVLSRDIL